MYRHLAEPEKSKYGSRMLPYKKQVALFLVGWMGFQVIASIIQIVIGTIASVRYGIALEKSLKLTNVSMIVNAIAYIALFVTLGAIANRDLVKLSDSFKQYQSYIAGVLCFLAILVFSNLYGNILIWLKAPTASNSNQTGLDNLGYSYPITCLFLFGVLTPICEELTYRAGLFAFAKRQSKFTAYAVTIIIFAFIHFTWTTDGNKLIIELLNLPHYLFAAAAFSFVFDKYGFAASTTAHIICNVSSFLPFVALH